MFQKIHQKSVEAASNAAAIEDAKWGDRFGMCGFAWVTEKDWTGKTYQIWNPSGYSTQNIDVKEAGAEAYVSMMNKLGSGIRLTTGSRLD
jgi:hypothetical protein